MSFLNHGSDIVVKKTYFDTKQGQVHCRVSQPRKDHLTNPAPVLLLHMSASSSKSCIALMQILSARGFSCFAPDMPGFGESFDPEDAPSGIDWYSDLYHEVFRSLPEFHHGCHVIGHHSGAVIGTDLAAKYADFVHSLTLVGPAIMSAEERRSMAQKTMIPFNQPVIDGSHLSKTWEYLIEHGIPPNNLDLLHRELLDHSRAWRGRMQIYACVWAYDCAASLESIDKGCKVLALCAQDDVLWPMFGNVKLVRSGVRCKEIQGANFEPDLGAEDIAEEFLALNGL